CPDVPQVRCYGLEQSAARTGGALYLDDLGGEGDNAMSQFQGSLVALVTPFRNGQVDDARIRDLVELHVREVTDAIVACGTTGEDPGLTGDEHERVVETIIATATGRIPVVVGTGSNSTAHTIELTRHAERAGAA